MSDPMIEEDSLISQDDIDKLMESSSIEEAEDKFAKDEDPVDELGELSQDDIDQLMNSNTASEEKVLPALDDDEDFEELSEEDIKALMGSQDPTPEKENGKKQEDFVINESEALGVADCLISQGTIDGLIKNFNTNPVSDPAILDEDPLPALKSNDMPDPDTFKMPLDAVSNDTEDFLKPESDADVLELNDDREDVTQEDIDALLTESDDEEETEDDVLISQDDIDTLLTAADQEDEDVLGDLMDTSSDINLDEYGSDEDILEKGASDEEEEEIENEEENEDQVVLQGDDEVAVKPKKKKKKAGVPWYKKKLVLASFSLLVTLGITVPITYFFFFSGGQKPPEIVSVPEKPVVSPQREAEIQTVEAPVKQPMENKKPGNMILKGFVILTPDISKGMTYVTADVSIDYADQKAFQEIQNNLSYFRDLIYDSIRKSLVEKREKITEAEILSLVETTLKKVLPGNSINRVGFISFKIS